VGGGSMAAVGQGRTHEILPFTGQTAGLIGDVQPAAKIVKNLVAEAERAVELGLTPVPQARRPPCRSIRSTLPSS
jgi:hypothetical protein